MLIILKFILCFFGVFGIALIAYALSRKAQDLSDQQREDFYKRQ